MRTEDWVNVGLRLFGAYLMVDALLGCFDWLQSASSEVFADILALSGAKLVLQFALGICLFNWGKGGERGKSAHT